MDITNYNDDLPMEWQGDCDDESCKNNNQEGKCQVEICQYVPM